MLKDKSFSPSILSTSFPSTEPIIGLPSAVKCFLRCRLSKIPMIMLESKIVLFEKALGAGIERIKSEEVSLKFSASTKVLFTSTTVSSTVTFCTEPLLKFISSGFKLNGWSA